MTSWCVEASAFEGKAVISLAAAPALATFGEVRPFPVPEKKTA
jgi:hypothetical protein